MFFWKGRHQRIGFAEERKEEEEEITAAPEGDRGSRLKASVMVIVRKMKIGICRERRVGEARACPLSLSL